MSLVGPRPVVLDEIERYGPYAAYYYGTRPGLTGLWQVSGRNDTTYDERVEFDVSYCVNWSIWKDLVIVFRTFPVLFSGSGSY
jgi:exopolysaccharide production protein ExoY